MQRKTHKTRKHGNKRGGEGHSRRSLALSRRTIKSYSNFPKNTSQTANVLNYSDSPFDKIYSYQETIKTQKNPEFNPSNIQEKYKEKLEDYKKKINEYDSILKKSKLTGNQSCSLIAKLNSRNDCIKLTKEIRTLHAKFVKLHKDYPELKIPHLPSSIDTNIYSSKAQSQKATPLGAFT